MTVVEEVKSFSQLEGVFRQVGWFGGGRGLRDHLFEACRKHHQRPKLIAAFACEHAAEKICRFAIPKGIFDHSRGALAHLRVKFAEDRTGAHSGVLAIWSSFAIEREGFFEVEGDDGMRVHFRRK